MKSSLIEPSVRRYSNQKNGFTVGLVHSMLRVGTNMQILSTLQGCRLNKLQSEFKPGQLRCEHYKNRPLPPITLLSSTIFSTNKHLTESRFPISSQQNYH